MLLEKLEKIKNWEPPIIAGAIPHGDMPGDKVEINDGHIMKANVIFPALLEEIKKTAKENKTDKVVVTVCGGSGVGKSETASLLAFYLSAAGIGCYTLSGDNYPHRIPMYNDAERLRIFRESGIKGMLKDDTYTKERGNLIRDFASKGEDADPKLSKKYTWYESYLKGGREGLEGYLGTPNEIGFEEIEEIVSKFKSGANKIFLRRMGRTDTELWYDEVNMKDVNVLIIEWTHGNSDYYEGVDIPVFLYSTPEETLEHRRLRARDKGTDSPFTTMVLEIEQDLLMAQSKKAKIIVSKSGEIIDEC